MSYEGLSRFLCKDGHLWTRDAFEVMYNNLKDNKCPICGKPAIWENMVDYTNGSFDGENRIDGFIELDFKKKYKAICENCGKIHICNCSTYKIPKKKRVREEKMKTKSKNTLKGINKTKKEKIKKRFDNILDDNKFNKEFEKERHKEDLNYGEYF